MDGRSPDVTRPLIHLAEVDLGRQRSPEHERGDHMVSYLRSANVGDGIIQLDDVKQMNFSPAEQRTFALRGGDVLVTEGSGSRDAVGMSAVWREDLSSMVCFQNTLLRIRPRPGKSDGRFLAWWARHAHASRLMAAVAWGAIILHLSAEELRRLPVPDIDVAEQRRIADFLDDQVARIDNVIAARRAQVRLNEDLWAETLRTEIMVSTHPAVPLWAVVRWQEGPGILAKDFRDDGVPILRIAHLRASPPSLEGCQFVDASLGLSRWGHFRTAIGDLILSGSASVGELAVWVTPDVVGAIPYTGLIRVRARDDRLLPNYMRYFFLSKVFGDQIDLLKSGIGIQHWGPSHLSQIRIPLPTASRQTEILAILDRAEQDHVFRRSALARSIALLEELKRSLITAAVTGEFDVETADRSRVLA
jgi:type I restriction enzyme S subunit